MAKKDINENTLFYRIAIEQPDYTFIESIPKHLRNALQVVMQQELAKQLAMVHCYLEQEAPNDHG